MERNDELLDLFLHPGWKHFHTEMAEALETLKATAYIVRDEKELFRRKGEIQQLSYLVNYEELIKARIDEELRNDDVI